MLSLHNLLVMQEDLRYINLDVMIAHVATGGLWNLEYLTEYSEKNRLGRISPLIQISRFEDQILYLHDGHHRCVATWLAGRNHLYDSEYVIADWTYESYLEINHQNGWYTPFDPRIYVRTADFGKFKKDAKIKCIADENAGIEWIKQNFGQFRRLRTLTYLPELANKMKEKLCTTIG